MDVRSKKMKKMDFWIVSVYILMLFCLKIVRILFGIKVLETNVWPKPL